jgi:ribosomal protein S12 methylthiotransferase accessory factor
MIARIPEFPSVKAHLVTGTINDDEVFVLSEERALLWKSRGFGLLIPALDGTRSQSELFEHLQGRLSPPEIMYVLGQLNELRLLAEGGGSDGSLSTSELAFWHALGVGDQRPPRPYVRLRAITPTEAGEILSESLRTAGIEQGEDEGAALDVFVTDHYFRRELADFNCTKLSSRSPWMVCKLTGRELWIGPIFHPEQTACMACLQNRLRLNRQVEDFVVRKTGDESYYQSSAGSSTTLTRLGVAWATAEIALWLSGRTDRLEGKLLSVTLGPKGLDIATHVVVRRPQCRICGDPDRARTPLPIRLQRRPVSPGSDRVELAGATLRRLDHHISPITGIVTTLSNSSPDTAGVVHCYNATHNFSLGLDTIGWLGTSLRPRTGGKGATPEEARTSAVCEAIERYCGVFHQDVPRIRSTFDALGEQAVHPHQCLNFSPRQYDRRDELNSDLSQGVFHLVPRRFPEDLETDWVALWSLSGERIKYLPAALCYSGHPDVEQHFYCASDANGCAAGNVIEEAILHAVLELVERDSASIWWYNRCMRPGIDLNSVADPYITCVREHYARNKRDIWALDITSDLEIPAIVAVSRRNDGPPEELLIGLSAHVDPAVALRRAITEVNQFFPAVARRRSDGTTQYCWPDDLAVRFWKQETLSSQPHLMPDRAAVQRTVRDLPQIGSVDLCESLQACLDRLHRAGLEVMILDQSRPDVELSVVRVVVPGLRHFWRRLGPGRLYDVPVKLGWLAAQRAEMDLNPTAMFF